MEKNSINKIILIYQMRFKEKNYRRRIEGINNSWKQPSGNKHQEAFRYKKGKFHVILHTEV